MEKDDNVLSFVIGVNFNYFMGRFLFFFRIRLFVLVVYIYNILMCVD